MIAKPTILIVGFCSLPLAICMQSTLHAQSPMVSTQSAQVARQDSTNDLSVAVGKSVLIDSAKPIERISVGLGDFAEATAVGPSEIMVNGKAPGETSLIVWQVGGGRQFFNLTVRANSYAASDRMEGIRRELRAELPGQALQVSSENGVVFLRGTVKDLTSSQRAVQIASTSGKVVNLLYVDVPPSEPQVLLKVRFASIDRTLTTNLGLNIFSTGATNTIGTITTQQFSPPTISGVPGTPGAPPVVTLSGLANLFFFRPDLNLGAVITALQNNGILQMLAEPNLLAANGKQASFLAGGEYPYPVVQGITGGGTGAVTIQFQEFGVRLNFIPTVTARNTIRLQVAPEVSSLDFADGVTISGFTVPALNTRKVKTEIELKDGQSFAIAGLLDNRETKNLEKIPFIGDIPVLGKLFQSISKSRTNTELIVIVTPEIVAPIPAGAPLPELKYPDAFLPPISDMPMTNPGASVTGAKPLPPAPSTIPVEQLIQDMQPEQPLMIDSMSAGAAYGSSQNGAAAGAPSQPGTPPQQ